MLLLFFLNIIFGIIENNMIAIDKIDNKNKIELIIILFKIVVLIKY